MKTTYLLYMPDDVLPDQLFTYSQMDIQAFLEDQNSFLAKHKVGRLHYPAWLESICREADVNPKLILALLQREWLLVEQKGKPPEALMARCLGIRDNYGFEDQHKAAVLTLDRIFTPAHKLHRQRAVMVDSDILKITPANACTTALYTYPSDSAPWTGDTNSLYYSKWKAHGSYRVHLSWAQWWGVELANIPRKSK